MSKFVYKLIPGWPPLAWLAELSRSSSEISVEHGPRVETLPDWFCEAVWDGDFEAGDFDRTDIVFGSGARVRSTKVIFVSSGATVDRLQFFEKGDSIFLSNSLACLRSVSAGWPSTGFRSYPSFFRSIIQGTEEYQRVVPENGPTLIYFRNLAWDGRNLQTIDKPWPSRDFSSFDAYIGFLRASLQKIAANARSKHRALALDLIGTASSGYDSPTVAALARCAGLTDVISFATAREESADDGSEIAGCLGLRTTILDRRNWRTETLAEAAFLVGDARGGDLFYAGAKGELQNKVLLTGYHGDKIWDKETKSLTPAIVRGDASGLSFTEYRLRIGTIHVPVPFFGVRNIRDINGVSKGSEMAPWDLGGDYNRPICRRILEEAGVPRALFGMRKKATGTLFDHGDVCFTHASRADLHRWFRAHVQEFRTAPGQQFPKIPLLSRWHIPELWFHRESLARRLLARMPERIRDGVGWRLTAARFRLYKEVNRLVHYAFPWALERLAEEYRKGKDEAIATKNAACAAEHARDSY